MPRCCFDAQRTLRGVECLRHYRKRYNDSLQEFTDTPVHDWASHGADAFRYLAVRHKTPVDKPPVPPPYPQTSQWS